MGQLEQSAYPPGTIVFAKLKGYPWWPAKIEDERSVPARILKQKTKTKSPVWTVFFFGSRDYGFFGPDSIRPFNRVNVEKDLKARKFKTKDLELAVREALDPSALEEEERDGEEEDEDEEEEERNESPPEKKRKTTTAKGGKKNNTNKKTSTTKTVASAIVDSSDHDDTDTSSTNKKRIITDKEENKADKKKRRKSMSTEKEDMPNGDDHTTTSTTSSRKFEEGLTKDGESIEDTREYKRLYHLRHRLQKLLYEKKDGEIPEEDYPKISQHLKDVEEAPITYYMLKHTKIGKVVKAGCGYNFTNDTEHNLRERCQQLMRKWKEIFLDSKEQVKDNTTQKVPTST